MAPPEFDVAELGWKVAAAEKRLDAFEAGLASLRNEIAAGFAAIRIDIKEQGLVTKAVYDNDRLTDARIAAVDRKSQEDYAGETRKIASNSMRVSIATLTFTVAALGAILLLIKAVAP